MINKPLASPLVDVQSLGARPQRPWSAAGIVAATAGVVVASSAVSSDNPEVSEALRLHIPVIPRAEM